MVRYDILVSTVVFSFSRHPEEGGYGSLSSGCGQGIRADPWSIWQVVEVGPWLPYSQRWGGGAERNNDPGPQGD